MMIEMAVVTAVILKVKVPPILETSVWFRSWSQSSAVSLQVTEATNPVVGCPLLSARPAVTARAAEHHCSLAGSVTKLYCLMTEAHVCKQLAQGCTWQQGGWNSNPRPVDRMSSSLTTRPRRHASVILRTRNSLVTSPHQHSVFTGRMPFLSPKQQCLQNMLLTF